jgi:RNA polymerase sigma factor (sigma-70 family)
VNDSKLLKGCINGEAHCQRLLVERFSPMLLTVARRYAGNLEDAEDILQDALVKILTALQKGYNEQGRLEAWMRTIVITTALNALDRKWVRHEQSVDQIPEDLPCTYPDVFGQLGAEELLKVIATLPDGYREIFNLAVIEQYSHAEIASLLGISESTSRSQLTRARRLLQTLVLQQENVRL